MSQLRGAVQRSLNLDREKVLDRLWEIAYLSPEMTRGSITGQVKALSMIVAMQNFIPDRRALSSEKKSPPAPNPQSYDACPSRPPVEPPAEPAVEPERPVPPVPATRGAGRGSVVEGPAVSSGPSKSTFANRYTPSEAPPLYVPLFGSIPDLKVGLPIKNPFVHPR